MFVVHILLVCEFIRRHILCQQQEQLSALTIMLSLSIIIVIRGASLRSIS